MANGHSLKQLAIAFGAALAFVQGSLADVSLPPIISDHMVLLKADKVPVWGKASAGEKVAVSLAGTSAETVAGADGKWRVLLDLSSKGPGPYEMSIQGQSKVIIADVLVGEVWLCSGQSNMELSLSHSLRAEEEIAASTNPLLRDFHIKKQSSLVPLEQCEGEWKVAGPATSGEFSGVGYYFGKMVQQSLQAPVGLVTSAWSGSALQAWISKEALDSDPDLKAGKDKAIAAAAEFQPKLQDFLKKCSDWQNEYGRTDHAGGDRASYASQDIDTADWKPVKLPGTFASAGLPDSGTVWLRRKVMVDEAAAREGWMQIRVGNISGYHEVYWDGKKIGETIPGRDLPDTDAKYRIWNKAVAPGEHTLALRVFYPAGNGGIRGRPESMAGDPMNLLFAGDWLAKAEFELPALSQEAAASLPAAPAAAPQEYLVATNLFNGMINPIIPYAIRGAIWYQGEANAGQAMQYQAAFPLMIRDWRSRWDRGDCPFYFCQLANYGGKRDAPGDSQWAEQREAQGKALALPATGMAVLIDTGAANNIHPKNRKDQGSRLAWIALAQTYAKPVPSYSGPTFESMEIQGDRVRIHFGHAEGGLIARALPENHLLSYRKGDTEITAPLNLPLPGSPLQGFAVCGEDRRWEWAEASIDGQTVVVSSPKVLHPIAVRYGWADNPTCNLYNGAGLPASPFRTDTFPGKSIGRYFLNNSPDIQR